MRNALLTLCAVFAPVVFSTNVRAGALPSPDNVLAGQQPVPEQPGTVVNGGAWTVNADIPNVNGTSQTTTASDSNGNVYVIGGGAGALPDITLRATWMYSPADDSWTPVADVPTPLRAFGSSATVSMPLTGGGGVADFFYVFGGFDGASGINTLNIYSVLDDTWFQGAPIPPSGGGFGIGVCQVNGRIFLAGGSNNFTQAFEYDVDSDSYTQVAPMGFGGAYRTHGAGVDAVNECHFFGFAFESTIHFIYHVDTNTWTLGPPMPVSVTDPAAVTIGTDIYVIGGPCPAGVCQTARTRIFDALGGTWSNGPDLPGIGLSNTSGTFVPSATNGGPPPGTLFVEGGFNDNGSVPPNYSLALP